MSEPFSEMLIAISNYLITIPKFKSGKIYNFSINVDNCGNYLTFDDELLTPVGLPPRDSLSLHFVSLKEK